MKTDPNTQMLLRRNKFASDKCEQISNRRKIACLCLLGIFFNSSLFSQEFSSSEGFVVKNSPTQNAAKVQNDVNISNSNYLPDAISNDNSESKEINNSPITSSFDIKSFDITASGFVNWVTVNENGSLTYSVEQYLFDRWVTIGKVQGKGGAAPNAYSLATVLNCGINKFRIKQKGTDNKTRYSDPVIVESIKEAVSYSIKEKNKIVEFSNETYFLVYNPYGEIIRKGIGKSIDISDYTPGYYCIVYDNQVGGFTVKNPLFKKFRFKIKKIVVPDKSQAHK